MAVDRNELREHVQLDRKRADELRVAVGEKLQGPSVALLPDMTGKPGDAVAFTRYKASETLALQAVQRDLFFARVDVTRSWGTAKNERVAMLVTKARVSPGTDGGDWETLAWTSPIVKDILDKAIGETFQFQVPGRPLIRCRRFGSPDGLDPRG